MDTPLSDTPAIPSAPAPSVIYEDGDDIREAPADQRGYIESLKKERAVKRELAGKVRALEAQLAEASKGSAEAQALKARLAELEPHATAWQAHAAAEAKRAEEANAARIAGLTDAQREAIQGLDPARVAKMLDAWAPTPGTPAAQPAPVKPTYPAGGAAPSGVPSGEELTPAERAWVESSRPDLRDVAPAAVKKMFKQFGPK